MSSEETSGTDDGSKSKSTVMDKKTGTVKNTEAAAAAVTVVDPRLLVREQGLAGYIGEFKRKLKAGDLGSSPSWWAC